MAEIDRQILEDFLAESKTLIQKMMKTLEKCEGDFSQVKSLEDYGLNVDRIMGAAKSIGVMAPTADHLIHKVGDYATICKAVGYKAAQIRDNEQFYDICIALLLDGTEVLEAMINNLADGKEDFKVLFSRTFLDRLKWVSSQFGSEYRSTVDIHKGQNTKLSQDDIDDLLKKMGLD